MMKSVFQVVLVFSSLYIDKKKVKTIFNYFFFQIGFLKISSSKCRYCILNFPEVFLKCSHRLFISIRIFYKGPSYITSAHFWECFGPTNPTNYLLCQHKFNNKNGQFLNPPIQSISMLLMVPKATLERILLQNRH